MSSGRRATSVHIRSNVTTMRGESTCLSTYVRQLWRVPVGTVDTRGSNLEMTKPLSRYHGQFRIAAIQSCRRPGYRCIQPSYDTDNVHVVLLSIHRQDWGSNTRPKWNARRPTFGTGVSPSIIRLIKMVLGSLQFRDSGNKLSTSVIPLSRCYYRCILHRRLCISKKKKDCRIKLFYYFVWPEKNII